MKSIFFLFFPAEAFLEYTAKTKCCQAQDPYPRNSHKNPAAQFHGIPLEINNVFLVIQRKKQEHIIP